MQTCQPEDRSLFAERHVLLLVPRGFLGAAFPVKKAGIPAAWQPHYLSPELTVMVNSHVLRYVTVGYLRKEQQWGLVLGQNVDRHRKDTELMALPGAVVVRNK